MFRNATQNVFTRLSAGFASSPFQASNILKSNITFTKGGSYKHMTKPRVTTSQVCHNYKFMRTTRNFSTGTKCFPKIQAVIGDMSGTWIDPFVISVARALIDCFASFGIVINNKQARGPMGHDKRTHIKQIMEDEDVKNKWFVKYERYPTESDIDTVFHKFAPMQIALLKDPKYNQLIPGTGHAINALQMKGIKFGSTSGFNAEMHKPIITALAKQGVTLDTFVASDQVRRSRPYPDAMWENMSRLGVTNVKACVKVGDTDTDIEEGLAAGCIVIGLAKFNNHVGMQDTDIDAVTKLWRSNSFEAAVTFTKHIEESRKHLIEAGAHFVVDDFGDVPRIIETINRFKN
jgi:phosphonoacetaldehyde hydrolase